MKQKKFFIVYIYLFPFFAIINLFAIQNEMKGQETVFMLVIHGIHYFFPLFFPHCQVMKQPLYFSQLINETERDILHWETEYSRRMRYQGGQGHWKLFSWQGNMATCSMEEFISLSSLKYFFLTEDTLNWREVTQMLYREIMHLGAFSGRGIFIHSCIGKNVLFLTSLWALLLGKADIWVEFCTKTCCSVLKLPAEDSLNDGPLNFEELQMLWRDNVCVRFFCFATLGRPATSYKCCLVSGECCSCWLSSTQSGNCPGWQSGNQQPGWKQLLQGFWCRNLAERRESQSISLLKGRKVAREVQEKSISVSLW